MADATHLPPTTFQASRLSCKGSQALHSPRHGIRSVSVTQPSSPSVNLRHGPHVQNMNMDLSYLDQDVKVLEKLGQVLQTDSVTEIQKWFATASIEESKKERLLLSTLRNTGPAQADTLLPGKKCN
ncbi:hypothetical protein llap_15223 [Limosa lapponica baueri]|uniref:Uncharacterized protein n=1 Tax=Limosa lapponica baueri TaxID=1758121 RepID=A0A2I0TL35_LIMLA|nr:hypothetical protein llap_15223 [Limosa lapponica baueri]